MAGNGPEGQRILVGVIGAAHGIKGEVRVKSYTAVPTDIATYRPLIAEGRQGALTILAVRPVKDDMVVARFEGVTTREAAEALTNIRLHVERSALPAAAEDEYYHADLIGLEAESDAGQRLGRVAAVLDFGAGDLLEIEVAGQDSLLVPFTKQFVPIVDIAAARVVVNQAALATEDEDGDDGEPAPDTLQ